MNTPYSRPTASARGFSLVELLIALAISAMLMTASLSALDATFKSYQMTTEAASTHVVTRIVMQRVMSLIRVGKEFGPYPDDVLDPDQNPIVSNSIEFVSDEDENTGYRQITRIERRDDPESGDDAFALWYVREDYEDGVLQETVERMMIRNLIDATFILQYDVGPRLLRATVDIVVRPDDVQDEARMGGVIDAPAIRMVSTAAPRTLE